MIEQDHERRFLLFAMIAETFLGLLIIFGMVYFVLVVIPVTTSMNLKIADMSVRLHEDVEISKDNFELSKKNGEYISRNQESLKTLSGDLKAFIDAREESRNRADYLAAHKETQRLLGEIMKRLDKK